MQKRTAAVAVIGAVGMTLILAACGSSKSGSSSSSSANTFVLSEFTIIPPTNTLHSGSATLTANNVGGENHELVIVRAPNANALPMKSDGSIDEDRITATDKVGEIAEVAAHSQKTKTFNLTSGTYVAFCNIVDNMMGSTSSMMNGNGGMTNGSAMNSSGGHVHFAKGMHATFTVN